MTTTEVSRGSDGQMESHPPVPDAGARPSRVRRWLRGAAVHLGIVAATLVAVDLFCIAFGLFPPRINPGDPDLGWRAAAPSGAMTVDRCQEFSTGEIFSFTRNEDGVRTSYSAAPLRSDHTSFKIGVSGDSHTELCAPNAQTHWGVLETELRSAGVSSVVLPFGAGRYSPLQAYLAFREVLLPYGPDAFVLNLYTGNDFQDILRMDDRPYLAATGTGYEVVPPVWFLFDDPSREYRSRVGYAFRMLAKRTGLHGLAVRLRALSELASEQQQGFRTVAAYMSDLRQSSEPTLGYPNALTAQMLNQQLFFHHFPGAREESIRRIEALMSMIRNAHPDLMLVMSPLPSYLLVGEKPVDPALPRVLSRLPITYEEGVAAERELYDTLRELAARNGWLFVDNLAALRTYHGTDRLYNDFDYHLLPVASRLVGAAQAETIEEHYRTTWSTDGLFDPPRRANPTN